jgi:hypothetical protein
MASLVESLSQGSPETVRSLAARFSQPNDFVHKALQVSAAAMLSAIAGRAKEPAFMSQVTNLIVAAPPEAGSTFLSTLFGPDRPLVERKIAEASGVPGSAATVILTTAAPLLLGILAPKIASHSLQRVVTDDLPRFVHLVPAGVPGQSRLPDLAAAAAAAVSPHQRTNSHAAAGRQWMWPMLLLGALLIVALVWYGYRGVAGLPD